jgi:hypothetical protein
MQTFTCDNCSGQYEAETQGEAETVGWYFTDAITLCSACDLIRIMNL